MKYRIVKLMAALAFCVCVALAQEVQFVRVDLCLPVAPFNCDGTNPPPPVYMLQIRPSSPVAVAFLYVIDGKDADGKSRQITGFVERSKGWSEYTVATIHPSFALREWRITIRELAVTSEWASQ